MAALTLGVNYAGSSSAFGDEHISIRYPSGNANIIKDLDVIFAKGIGLGWATDTSVTGSSATSAPSIIFGSGDTPVTYDDYMLASQISTDIVKSNIYNNPSRCSYNASTKKWTSYITMTLTNNSTSAITIKEVGIKMALYGTTIAQSALVYREVLASPITISAGETVTYTQHLEYQMPTIA